MFSLIYEHKSYYALMRDLAAAMEVCVEGDFILMPAPIGSGYFKSIVLSNGLQCLLTNCTLNQDIYLNHKRSEEEFYTLRFNESTGTDSCLVRIDQEYLWEGREQNAFVLLTSSLFDFAQMISKGTVIKSIDVLMPREWLLQCMAHEGAGAVLKKYLLLKTSSCNFALFDDEYRALFNEIMSNNDGGIRQADIESTLIILLKKFINELSPKLDFINEKDKIKISEDEFKRLMQVESYLINNYSTPPPSIYFLSKLAAMSPTSLKIKFKKMYGSPLYEYYQKGRMERAKVLMLTHKYSIKQIGCQLGYSNLSNFSIAFKKEYKRLPSHYLLSLNNAHK